MPENDIKIEKQKKAIHRLKNITIILLLGCIIFLLQTYFEQPTQTIVITHESNPADLKVVETPPLPIEEEPIITTFDILSSEDWSQYEDALLAIQSAVPGQIILDGILLDPTNGHLAYFATSAYDNRSNSNLVGIYSFNTEDKTARRLFRTTYEIGEIEQIGTSSIPEIHVVGYDENDLILLLKDRSLKTKKCTNELLLATNNTKGYELVRMQIRHPYETFTKYELPNTIKIDFEDTQTACRK